MNAPIISATRRTVRLVGAAALVVGFAACSSDGADESSDDAEPVESAPADGTDTTEAPADPGEGADSVDASIVDFAFEPEPVAVANGGTVTWTNDGGAPHTVTGTGELEFDSGTLAPGDAFTLTVDGTGEFAYVCTIHGQMTGTISSS